MRKIIVLLLVSAFSSALACTNQGGLFGRSLKVGYPVAPGCNHPFLLSLALKIQETFAENGSQPLRIEAWQIRSGNAKPERVVGKVIDALAAVGFKPSTSDFVGDAYLLGVSNAKTGKFILMYFFIGDQEMNLIAFWGQRA